MSLSYTLIKGTVPLIISMPHNGQAIPESIAATMTPQARKIVDTDWYLDRLYDFALALGAYIIMPKYSRYVIDLNREPNGVNLYPSENSTELCPTSTFDLSPIYSENQGPNKQQIKNRIESYWQPYHQALAQTLNQMKGEFGQAVLLDAHSISSEVPRFFDGKLPDFNFGTNSAKSCSPLLTSAINNLTFGQYSKVTNGRFKGGYITRQYGQPESYIHAIQLELSQRTYMDEVTLAYQEELATEVKPYLENMVKCLIDFSQGDKQ